MSDHTILIFANGDLHDPAAIKRLAAQADMIIAADGGLVHIQALALRPSLLIGDLDSVTSEQVLWAKAQGADVHRFPKEKDETDLELALLAAAKTNPVRIIVTAALGGRLDQTLSNIFLLNLPELANLDVRIDDGHEEVILVRESLQIAGMPGEMVSLLPLSPIVRGITTSGLEYPLMDESMVFYHSRGISNSMIANAAQVEIQSGILICIHARKGQSR